MPIIPRRRQRSTGRVWLAAALAFGAVTAAPQAVSAADESFQYSFEFVNGVTLEGSSPDKVSTIADAGGASVESPTGMTVHLSCSDTFPGGWGEKDGPELGVDTAWQIQTWQIQKFKDGKLDKTCGNTVDPDAKPDGKNYSFTFVNGVTIAGNSQDNTAFLPNAGGPSAESPIGMEVHVSCSDEFPGGWGEKDGPKENVDTAWQIASYTIVKVKDGEIDKTCGDSFGPPIPAGVPAIDIEKYVNGDDADTPTGPVVNVGDTVTFDYVVANTGEVPLTQVAAIDETLGPITCPKTELAVGESMDCTPNTEVVIEAGQMFMEASVSGVGNVAAPGVTGTPPADDGRLFSFTFVNGVTIEGESDDNTKFLPNAGGTSATNPTGMEVHVSCSDEFPGGWGEKDGPTQGVDTAWQIASYEIVKYKDGEVDKICGETFTPSTQTVTDSDPVYFIAEIPGTPSIDVEKYVNGDDADTPPGPSLPVGSIAEFTYVVTNDGEVPLTDIMLVDNVVGALDCPSTDLGPGESMDCTTTTMEVEAGQQFMEACVKGTNNDVDVDDCDPVYYVGVPVQVPTVDIEKFVNGEDADTPPGPTVPLGSKVEFRYRIENTGTEKLNDVNIVDDTLGTIISGIMLEPGQIRNYRRTVMVMEAGPIFMESEVCGVGETSGTTVCDDDPVHFVVEEPVGEPTIDIEKFVNGEDADTPTGPTVALGSKVLFRYRIQNTGTEKLTDVTIVDDTLGTIASGIMLEPGQIRNFFRTVMAMHAGPVFMESEVCGDGVGSGITVCDDDPVNFVVEEPTGTPSIDIEKWVNGEDADVPDGPQVVQNSVVYFRYRIENTGDVTLTNVAVIDDTLGSIASGLTLVPGEVKIFNRSVYAEHLGPVFMESEVCGDGDGTEVCDDDPVHFVVIPYD